MMRIILTFLFKVVGDPYEQSSPFGFDDFARELVDMLVTYLSFHKNLSPLIVFAHIGDGRLIDLEYFGKGFCEFCDVG